jgi:hypothetical protein
MVLRSRLGAPNYLRWAEEENELKQALGLLDHRRLKTVAVYPNVAILGASTPSEKADSNLKTYKVQRLSFVIAHE